MTCLGCLSDEFSGRADDTEDSARGIGRTGKIVLLDSAESFGRRGVARQDDERTAPGEQVFDTFESEAIDEVERAGSVGRSGIVAKIEIIEIGQSPADLG